MLGFRDALTWGPLIGLGGSAPAPASAFSTSGFSSCTCGRPGEQPNYTPRMVSCFSLLPRHQCRYYPLSDPGTSPRFAALPSFPRREQVCEFARQGWLIWEDREGAGGTAWAKVRGASVRGKTRSWLEQRVEVFKSQ